MATIIFAIILYRLWKNPKDKKNSDIFKLIFYSTIALTGLSALLESPGMVFFAILCLVGYSAYKKNQNNIEKERNAKYGFSGESFKGKAMYDAPDYSKVYASAPTTGKLPKTQSGRRKQIEDFNEKYNLYLTDEQIDSIVSSTYLSDTWKREVAAMGEKYETIHQWFTGPTAWLRLYIHAFIPQEITSDFAQQEKIAIYNFDQVFAYAEELGAIPLSEKINRVNERFFCQFDDITFMAAFRFLESRGIYHNLEVAKPMSSTSPIDDLAAKYETVEG